MISLIILNVVLFFVSLKYVYRRTQFVVPWLVLFSCVWSIPVGIYWYYSGKRGLEYAFSAYSRFSLPDAGADIVIQITGLIIFCSLLSLFGCLLADKLFKIKLYVRHVCFDYSNMLLPLFALWVCITFIIILLNDFPWYFVLVPTYAEGNIYVNYIFRTFYLIIPLVCLFISFKFSKRSVFRLIFIWALFISLSTGQRRNVVVFILFYGYFLLYFNCHAVIIGRYISFAKFTMLFLSGFSLVVILWVLRVISTNFIRDGVLIDPFSNRSAVDILFGSGATGLPTTFFVIEYVKQEAVSPLYNVYYGLTQIVPRSLWNAKPVGIDTVVQNKFYLEVSPSVFWFGDYVFSFGVYLTPILAFIFSFFITLFQKLGGSSSSPVAILISALTFANLFTFYKNGFGAFLATLSTSSAVVIILYFFLMLPYKKLKIRL